MNYGKKPIAVVDEFDPAERVNGVWSSLLLENITKIQISGKQPRIPSEKEPLMPATSISRDDVGKFDSTGLVDVEYVFQWKDYILTISSAISWLVKPET